MSEDTQESIFDKIRRQSLQKHQRAKETDYHMRKGTQVDRGKDGSFAECT